MSRGGYRPGAGRPKAGQGATPKQIAQEAKKAGQSPLDYMLSVMRNPEADQARRDRMAIAAAPFVHSRAAEGAQGKKEAANEAARNAGAGTEWGSDLESPTSSSVN